MSLTPAGRRVKEAMQDTGFIREGDTVLDVEIEMVAQAALDRHPRPRQYRELVAEERLAFALRNEFPIFDAVADEQMTNFARSIIARSGLVFDA